MIASMHFHNFKVLRDATLPLGRFTLILGANGSGKSTVFEALRYFADPPGGRYSRDRLFAKDPRDWETRGSLERVLSVHAPLDDHRCSVSAELDGQYAECVATTTWGGFDQQCTKGGRSVPPDLADEVFGALRAIRVFSLDARAIAQPMLRKGQPELASDGGNLAVVVERLRDRHPERWNALNDMVRAWLPEFDCILFDADMEGRRLIRLRTALGHHEIDAHDLSQGTLLALTMLTLAYLPKPPSLICLEEPDRGLHPRLLRDVQDALYRLGYPEDHGEKRDPVQVIATTHSPYMLDLFRDHPEEIVIATKTNTGATFQKLSDYPHIEEILGDAPLGEIWYSGILGGVPEGR